MPIFVRVWCKTRNEVRPFRRVDESSAAPPKDPVEGGLS